MHPEVSPHGQRLHHLHRKLGALYGIGPEGDGLYQDPYSDFGWLAVELWRAARLVVDTGIHHKRGTRQQAIDYLIKNTPNAEDDWVEAINRFIVSPSQATAYKIGMLKILDLRAKAKKELGAKFDVRHFHDVVLTNGPVPLDIREELGEEQERLGRRSWQPDIALHGGSGGRRRTDPRKPRLHVCHIRIHIHTSRYENQ